MAVGVFSGVVNGLQLTVSLYMMQVFDRVLSSGSIDTLVWLSAIALASIIAWAILEQRRTCSGSPSAPCSGFRADDAGAER